MAPGPGTPPAPARTAGPAPAAKPLAWLAGIGAGLLIPCLLAAAAPVRLQSPDGRVAATIRVDHRGVLRYGLEYRERTVLEDCRLGLEAPEGPLGPAGWSVVDVTRSEHDASWRPVYGERSEIRDHYRQVVIEVQDRRTPACRMKWTFRAYDQGFALQYTLAELPGRPTGEIRRERTEFRFLADHRAWAVYSAQGRYEEVPLSRIRPGCERPLTIQVAADVYAAVAEANLVDFARMKLAPAGDRPRTLVSDLSGPVTGELPLTSPWRVVLLADSPGGLLENNHLLLNLAAPCAIADTSWIRPGKVIREVTLTTAGGLACVDFAAAQGLQFVEFDAGWYGHEYADASDARTVTVDPQRSPGPLDLPRVIAYARERGIGIILYVNRRALERQLDEILPLYQRWGISGVKYGFVQVGSQAWTAWLHEAVRKAAAHRLMVDIHDEYRPTGYSRTYPNLMTQEGIAGDETSPENRQTLILLFTRMLAGAGDNTICYYDDRVRRNASHAYQLAKSVCLYSPWQFLFWYDRPPQSPRDAGGAGNAQRLIGDEPELEFFAQVPTVWDETRVLQGQIGELAVIARRRGRDWYVGCMNAGQPRSLTLPLDFLPAGGTYRATIYSDNPQVPTRTQVAVEQRTVDAGSVLNIALAPHGGQALRIVPWEPPP